jgi:hypothetical protein
MSRRTATLVRYRWDDQAGCESGWYAESYDADGNLIDDSQKMWWPDLDECETEEAVRQTLKSAFPGAVITSWD